MFSDAPPSRDDVTTSFTCRDDVDVNTFTSSGMIAPASVPHVITVDSFHQSVPSPSVGMIILDTKYVNATETNGREPHERRERRLVVHVVRVRRSAPSRSRR